MKKADKKYNTIQKHSKPQNQKDMNKFNKTIEANDNNSITSLIVENQSTSTFSWRKWILLPFLFVSIILCSYFALPTIESVAVPSGATQIEKRYVTKNIEDIQVGDYVYAFDVETSETVQRRVTNVLQRTSDHLRYLTVHDSNETQVFETTDSHPFWVVTDTPDLSRAAQENVTDNGVWLHHENVDATEHGYYVEAGHLQVGDVFISPHGQLSILEKTERTEYPNGITVYNFEVEDNHNYFVIANLEAFQNGAEPVLVHNAECLKKINIKELGHTKNIPSKAYNVLRELIKNNGSPPHGFVGGQVYKNDGNKLPRGGNYHKYDIERNYGNNQRGKRRIVIDFNSGRAWYTNNHYDSFKEM